LSFNQGIGIATKGLELLVWTAKLTNHFQDFIPALSVIF